MVADVYPDHGSLGGIFSGLTAAAGRGRVQRRLRHAVPAPRRSRGWSSARAGEAGRRHPARRRAARDDARCTPRRCLPHIEARLRAGRFKIVGFFDGVRVVEIAEAEIAACGRARGRLHERQHARRAGAARGRWPARARLSRDAPAAGASSCTITRSASSAATVRSSSATSRAISERRRRSRAGDAAPAARPDRARPRRASAARGGAETACCACAGWRAPRWAIAPPRPWTR